MTQRNAVEIVENFWRDVWQARDPEAIDRYVTEDFVLTSGGVDIRSRPEFKKWAAAFLSKINDFEFHVVETFQNEKGDRVASRWRITGKNNGFANTRPCQSPIEITGTAVWEIGEDGRLTHNWVERNAYEVYRELAKT
nr:hypothetical protein [uncultured bacterium]